MSRIYNLIGNDAFMFLGTKKVMSCCNDGISFDVRSEKITHVKVTPNGTGGYRVDFGKYNTTTLMIDLKTVKPSVSADGLKKVIGEQTGLKTTW